MGLKFSDYPELLAAIREKPGLYMDGRSVINLRVLLFGFAMAEWHYGIPEGQRLGGFDFNAFEAWVAARFNPERLSVGSFHLAQQAAGSDEGGFLLWFEWYDQFRHAPGA